MKLFRSIKVAEFILMTAISVSTAAPFSYAETKAFTLKDCYALALKQSENIAIQGELIYEAESHFTQALSGILPRVSFSSSDKRQGGDGGTSSTLRNVPERKFVFNQPLFAGFKEFAAMAQFKAERRQRVQEKARAEQLLFLDVSDAFYLLLEEREDLKVLEATSTTLLSRIDELKEREKLGRSRATEVVSAEAQLRRVEAEVERVKSLEVTARQLLEFLTNLEHMDSVIDSEQAIALLTPIDNYLLKSTVRSDVKALEEAWRAAEEEKLIKRADFFPTISLEGNSYTQRVGVSKTVPWDATLKVNVPLFEGGQNVGAYKETAARSREAKLRFKRANRTAALEIRGAYANLQAALAREAALKRAQESAEENYRLHGEDYKLNLVSNLDVLKALQDVQDVRRDVIHANYEVKRLYWQLRVVTGESL